MEASADFKWPDDPDETWWLTTGAGLGMSDEHVRFTAALMQLGGAEARKNSVAARLAGVPGGRSQAYRVARTVGVRKLLSLAERVRAGNIPRLTDAEIDRRVDDLIRSPDGNTAAKGIDLRTKRELAARQMLKDGDTGDPADTARALICAAPVLLGPVVAVGSWYDAYGEIGSFPHLPLVAPLLMAKAPDEWRRWRGERCDPFLDDAASGPVLDPDQLVAALKASGPRMNAKASPDLGTPEAEAEHAA